MIRPMPPHLYRERNRHGAVVFYIRKGKGPRIRVRGEFGSEEFARNYQSAIMNMHGMAGQGQARHGWAGPGEARQGKDTLEWLVACYQEASAWSRLSAITKEQRGFIFKRVVKRAGDVPLGTITKKVIQQGLEDRSKTPFAANNFLKTMRGLFQWAQRAQHVEVDPTEGIKGFSNKTEGYHTWTETDIKRFESRWPIGTRERLALCVLLYTGLRRGDATLLGRQHVRDGVITMRTAKTGQQVSIPILPELAEAINASPTGDLAFIATKGGRPMTIEGFGTWFRGACNEAGVRGSAHGLRKAGATRAANNGATVAQLNSIFGWHGEKMASLYTRQADRVKLAKDAIHKLLG